MIEILTPVFAVGVAFQDAVGEISVSGTRSERFVQSELQLMLSSPEHLSNLYLSLSSISHFRIEERKYPLHGLNIQMRYVPQLKNGINGSVFLQKSGDCRDLLHRQQGKTLQLSARNPVQVHGVVLQLKQLLVHDIHGRPVHLLIFGKLLYKHAPVCILSNHISHKTEKEETEKRCQKLFHDLCFVLQKVINTKISIIILIHKYVSIKQISDLRMIFFCIFAPVLTIWSV